jgi:septum formation protein
MGKAASREAHPELILVSTSPYRRELMTRLQLPFRAVEPRFEENHQAYDDPRKLVLELARGKAMSVAEDFPNDILIGSDQIVWFEGRPLGKPLTPERALQQLQTFRGKEHEFFTGLFLYDGRRHASQDFCIAGRARLRADLSDDELRDYIALDNPLHSAGGAKTEGPGLMLYDKLDCEDWTAIIGLPVMALATGLRKWGYPLFV